MATAESLYAEIRLALANVDRIQRNADEQVVTHTRLVELLESGDGDATHRYVGSTGSSDASAASGSIVTGRGTSPSSANVVGEASTGSV